MSSKYSKQAEELNREAAKEAQAAAKAPPMSQEQYDNARNAAIATDLAAHYQVLADATTSDDEAVHDSKGL